MADLRVTPARLALLRQVADPNVDVVRFYNIGDGFESRVGRKGVTAACDLMQAAGWIFPGRADSPSIYARRLWQITPTGQAVLDAHPKES